MTQYEVLGPDGKTVINTVQADAAFMAAAFPAGGYRPVELVPDSVPANRPSRRLTRRGFWNRFPASKEAVLRAVRLGAPAGALMLVGMLDRLNSRVESAAFVDLDDPQAIEGITWLSSELAPETVTLDGVSYPLRLTSTEANAILQPDPIGDEAFVA